MATKELTKQNPEACALHPFVGCRLIYFAPPRQPKLNHRHNTVPTPQKGSAGAVACHIVADPPCCCEGTSLQTHRASIKTKGTNNNIK